MDCAHTAAEYLPISVGVCIKSELKFGLIDGRRLLNRDDIINIIYHCKFILPLIRYFSYSNNFDAVYNNIETNLNYSY